MRARGPTKLTYADLELMPDDGKQHELIDGEHFVTPSPNAPHQIVAYNLAYSLRRYLEQHPIGRAFIAPFDVVCSQRDVVEPDLLYVSNARGDILTRQNIQGAPDLIIEILSEGTRTRDETLKMRLYERVGVSEYWIIDPEAEIVRVYRRIGERFECAVELSREAGDTLSSPLFPALAIPLEQVFEGTDIDGHDR